MFAGTKRKRVPVPDDQKRKTEGKGGMLQGNSERLHKAKGTQGRKGKK